MSDIADYPNRLQHPALGAATTVFAVVGRVAEIKGVTFVIEAFRRAGAADAALLIVGDGPADYVARCRKMAQNDPRVIFWGVEPDVKRIYAATDFVVRGDPQACVGRTVYEGLYAGSGVILPGLGEPDFLFEAERFTDAIHLYKAGDCASLAQTIAACTGTKVAHRVGRSNIAEHVRQFDRFLDGCIDGPAPPESRTAPPTSTLRSPA
jgi:glycosyltransferase involved in cell wall biosynthesis